MSDLKQSSSSNDVENKSEYTRDDTLVTLLKDDKVSMAELRRRGYGDLLDIVKIMIGVIPNCDHYLEIWPPAFHTYNFMVPNYFNVPSSILGFGVSKEMSVAMYRSSRAAECSYCSAHTCTFAVRRGVDAEAILQSTKAGAKASKTINDEAYQAVVEVSTGLGTVPSSLSPESMKTLHKHYSDADCEAIALGAIGMGFLNKVMDAISVELEVSTYAEVKDIMGPDPDGSSWQTGKAGHDIDKVDPSTIKSKPPSADGFFARLSHLRLLPGAISMEKKWTKAYKIPNSWPASGDFLQRCTGFEWPVVSYLHNSRAVFATCAMLRENTDPAISKTGVAVKAALGVIFARTVKHDNLEQAVRSCSELGATEDDLKRAAEYADKPEVVVEGVPALWVLAKAISPSPCAVTKEVVDVLRADKTTSPQIVEVVSWIAVLQLMHRMMTFYPPPYDEVPPSGCL